MKEKKYHYKLIIGFILGLLLSISSVYGAILYSSNRVYFNNSNGNITSTNVQGAIDELVTRYSANSSCPSGKVCIPKKTSLSAGDYIYYQSPVNTYPIDTTKTGYTGSAQGDLKPSELTIWRVLRVNANGTVEIISNEVSSTAIHFRGLTGYQYFSGYLNLLASQYENANLTVGSRSFGYNGQTATIEDTSNISHPAFWTCSTGETCTPDPDDYEAYGGGDLLHQSDFTLVQSVLGTRVAVTVGTSTAKSYWMASRYYNYTDEDTQTMGGRYISASGANASTKVYAYESGWKNYDRYQPLRPIVILKAGLQYYGDGSSASNPIRILGA